MNISCRLFGANGQIRISAKWANIFEFWFTEIIANYRNPFKSSNGKVGFFVHNISKQLFCF